MSGGDADLDERLMRIQRRLGALENERETLNRDIARDQTELDDAELYLKLAEEVDGALDTLSRKMLEAVAGDIRESMTRMLREVLEQDLELEVHQQYKNNRVHIEFELRHNGQPIDIMKGAGGSVANILSVGLRLFALKTLPEKDHRRFLALDEQDCWIQPEIIPRFAKIVAEAAQRLGFQILYITHHDSDYFLQVADKILEFTPRGGAIAVREIKSKPSKTIPSD